MGLSRDGRGLKAFIYIFRSREGENAGQGQVCGYTAGARERIEVGWKSGGGIRMGAGEGEGGRVGMGMGMGMGMVGGAGGRGIQGDLEQGFLR